MLLHIQVIRKHFIVASMLLTSCGALSGLVMAQTAPCKASLSTLPAAAELKGFHLGMTTEQVKVRAPQIIFGRTDELGISKTTINPSFDPRADKSTFQDVRTISLDFLDGRLVSLWIGYDSTFKWNTIEAFVTGISQSLSLPSAWSNWKARGKEITCTDFQMTVSLIAESPSFRIIDTSAEETIAARRAAAAEEAEETERAESEAPDDSEEIEVVADRKTKTYYPGSCQPRVPIAADNRVTFKSSIEAEKAGYTPSKTCS